MNELTDAQINALADTGAQFLRETGLGRLLNDIFKPSPQSSPETGGWQGGSTEWPKQDLPD